jgi:hypothetical protein
LSDRLWRFRSKILLREIKEAIKRCFFIPFLFNISQIFWKLSKKQF